MASLLEMNRSLTCEAESEEGPRDRFVSRAAAQGLPIPERKFLLFCFVSFLFEFFPPFYFI
jgi:hypothetical protein